MVSGSVQERRLRSGPPAHRSGISQLASCELQASAGCLPEPGTAAGFCSFCSQRQSCAGNVGAAGGSAWLVQCLESAKSKQQTRGEARASCLRASCQWPQVCALCWIYGLVLQVAKSLCAAPGLGSGKVNLSFPTARPPLPVAAVTRRPHKLQGSPLRQGNPLLTTHTAGWHRQRQR